MRSVETLEGSFSKDLRNISVARPLVVARQILDGQRAVRIGRLMGIDEPIMD